jgi:hypothetical protein
MGKLSTAEASCSRRLPSETKSNTAISGPDMDRLTKQCNDVEGVSEIHVAGRGDLTSEATRIATLIDQWYRLHPDKLRVPFLPLVDVISSVPIKTIADLDARFDSRLYLR